MIINHSGLCFAFVLWLSETHGIDNRKVRVHCGQQAFSISSIPAVNVVVLVKQETRGVK